MVVGLKTHDNIQPCSDITTTCESDQSTINTTYLNKMCFQVHERFFNIIYLKRLNVKQQCFKLRILFKR